MLRSPLKKLEDEIRDCEARVRLHDTRVLHSAHLLREGVVQAASSKLVWGGAAALGGLIGLLWSQRRPKHHRRHRGHEDDDERYYRRRARRRRSSLPDLLQHWGPMLLPLLTPLLDRKVAMQLARLGLPVNVKPLDPLPTVAELDLERYAGRWYEVARLPTHFEKACSRDVTADYEVDSDGGMKVVNRCVHPDGRAEQVEGKLRVRDQREPGQAEVSFAPSALRWWPGTWGDYWVLFVDEEYQVSLVGTPDRDRLWVLSRTPSMDTADLEALKSLALRHGFDSTRMILTSQTASQVEPSTAAAGASHAPAAGAKAAAQPHTHTPAPPDATLH
jgi:apolipoprotein D and lipocalin family protein